MLNSGSKLGCLLGLLCVYATTAASEDLGRLFFSAAERLQIEQAQRRKQAEIAQMQTQAVSKTKTQIPEWLQINGLVIREQHDNVIWINDKQNLTQAGVRIDTQHPDGISIPMQLIDKQSNMQLKPGQKLNTRSGEIVENFQTQKAR